LNDAKKFLASKGLTCKPDYIKFLLENNITFLPANAESTYNKYGWSGWAKYLNCTQDVYQSKIAQNRLKKNVLTQDVNFAPVVSVAQPVKSSLNADKVIAFLIEEKIDPHCIIRMIAKLNITDATCFVDVCRYLESSKYDRALKPSSYNTLEPSFRNR
jgi:hypothetical protein